MENQAVINTLNVYAYSIYLFTTLLITILVARVLFKNSKVFMLDIFHGKQEIAMSTNRLFEIGFYLLNVGAALLILPSYDLLTKQVVFEVLSSKIGGFSIYLGIILFINIYLFFRGRKKSNMHANHSNIQKLQ